MAGRALCIIRLNRINSTFRLSCADKRIDRRHSSSRLAVLWRASGVDSSIKTGIQGFYQGVTNSAYWTWLSEYNTVGLNGDGTAALPNGLLFETLADALDVTSRHQGIPCATLRENTERPITISEGTNRLLKAATLPAAAQDALAGKWPKGSRPALWDGQVAQRAARSLRARL